MECAVGDMSASAIQLVRYSAYIGADPTFQDLLDVWYDPGRDNDDRMILDIGATHLNAARVLHGGMVMTLLDVAMAARCRRSDSLDRAVVTVEVKVNFLRPGGRAGERVAAHGLVRHTTKSLIFCDGELRDTAGQLLATASGTFKYRNHSGPTDACARRDP